MYRNVCVIFKDEFGVNIVIFNCCKSYFIFYKVKYDNIGFEFIFENNMYVFVYLLL